MPGRNLIKSFVYFVYKEEKAPNYCLLILLKRIIIQFEKLFNAKKEPSKKMTAPNNNFIYSGIIISSKRTFWSEQNYRPLTGRNKFRLPNYFR
jgi:hypothetical protein